MNCVEDVEEHITACIHANYSNRPVVIGCCAHATEPTPLIQEQNRGKCQARNISYRDCPFGSYFRSNASTLPWAQKTGYLTIRPNAVVHSIIYDGKLQKAIGVKVIDAVTKQITEYFVRLIFVNASCLNTNLILLNSTSNRFPNGWGNHNELLGKYIAFHNYRARISAVYEGFEYKYHYGRRPTMVLMPSFKIVRQQETDFKRGYIVAYSAERSSCQGGDWQAGLGASFKESLLEPGHWNVYMMMQGETIPKESNQVRLSTTEKDSSGIPQLMVSDEYDENDEKITADFLKEGREMLSKAGCKFINPIDTKQSPGLDIHEMGGVRMGNDPKTSLLNNWNQLHLCKNVFVTDGACMTSTGTQNPSLTYMALTARAANYAADQLKKNLL
jgi:choline dehydrogenase-like flavoprotein